MHSQIAEMYSYNHQLKQSIVCQPLQNVWLDIINKSKFYSGISAVSHGIYSGLCTELYHGMFFIFGTLLITSFLLFCLILASSYVHHYYKTKPSRVLPMQMQDFQANHPVYVHLHASSRSAEECHKCDSGSVHSTELFNNGKGPRDKEKEDFLGTYTLAPVRENDSQMSRLHQHQQLTNMNSGSDIDEQRLRDIEEGRTAATSNATSNYNTATHGEVLLDGGVEMTPMSITGPPHIPLYIHHNPAPIITQNSGRSSDSPNENQSLLPHDNQGSSINTNPQNNSSNEALNSDIS